MTDDKKLLEERLELLQPKIVKNIKVETSKELGTEYCYHVATNKQKVLVPNVSRRGADSEDNTCSRVCVGLTIHQCIMGYASVGSLPRNHIASKDKKADYKGGLYIHRLKFKVICKPTKKLVYDCEETNERWLVAYDTEQPVFPAEIVGTLIPIHTTTIPMVNKYPITHYTLFLEVLGNDIPIDEGIVAKKGFYSFTVVSDLSKPMDKIIDFKIIEESEYNKQ